MSARQSWVLDACVFINFANIERLPVLVAARKPLYLPEYVYRVELTDGRSPGRIRESAAKAILRDDMSMASVTLADLAELGGMDIPSRVGYGELCCALVAMRTSSGVLSDDKKAKMWLVANLGISRWESTEEVLVDAAHLGLVDEWSLDECQEKLEKSRYRCAAGLRETYLIQRLQRTQ